MLQAPTMRLKSRGGVLQLQGLSHKCAHTAEAARSLSRLEFRTSMTSRLQSYVLVAFANFSATVSGLK